MPVYIDGLWALQFGMGGANNGPTGTLYFTAAESVSLETLVERLGRLDDERMRQICRALEIAVASKG